MKRIMECGLRICFLAVLSLSAFSDQTAALDNGLSRTPPMGWNTWNKFGCNLDEQMVRNAADAMIRIGMQEAGYQYVIVDDCWQSDRDSQGNPSADPKRFPSGIKALADYVHARGLKFGLYADAGDKTCAGRPGSRGHEYQDARQFAAWGVDYLKYDWCHTTDQDPRLAYTRMRDALHATGRPIVFSICEWGRTQPWLWAKDVGNLWRTTPDIMDRWEGKAWPSWLFSGYGLMDLVDAQADLTAYAGPGHWNDPDMLEVGNGGMSNTEYTTHFSLWAIMAAPLIAGNDMKQMSWDIRSILTNKEVIAVDQDPLGVQGRRVQHSKNYDLWVKPLHDGTIAVAVVNRSKTDQTFTVRWPDIGLPTARTVAARDLWAHRDLGTFTGGATFAVASHGVMMLKVK
jgi:alpha-galactosidase